MNVSIRPNRRAINGSKYGRTPRPRKPVGLYIEPPAYDRTRSVPQQVRRQRGIHRTTRSTAGGTQHPGNSTPSLPLLSHHLDELRASGLTDQTIVAAGIYSEASPAALAEILHWSRPPRRLPPAIVFPYFGPQGPLGYCRIKADNPRQSKDKLVKYESPRGLPNEIYLPPNTIGVLNDAAVPLIITEGEKKALAADQHGHHCVGLVGVCGWNTPKQNTLCPPLERVSWRGRDVFIAFDSDLRHNTIVQDAEIRLAAALVHRGANVKVLRLPDGPPDEEGNPSKVGVDDFLVRHGLNAFQQLVADAEQPADPTFLDMKQPANKLDPCAEIGAFLEIGQEQGVSKLRYWRGSWYLYGEGYYAELSHDDIQGVLVRHLNDVATSLTMSILSNHMMQLRAQANLPDNISPPAWLGRSPCPWPVSEVLACKNQLIHLPSLITNHAYSRPATPLFFTPVALDYDFDVHAGRPDEWLQFLHQLWPNDPQSVALLQQWFGYCLTLDTRQQKILLIVGPPRSGKGTIARILRYLIGEQNVCGPTLASFGERFGLWPLLSKSVAIVSDARLGGRTDSSVVTERLLSISGEDTLTIDRKQLSAVTCKLETRLMLLSNELPKFTDASGALAGRMLLARLSESWLGREDHGLFSRLKLELPGILLWAIDGWRRLREQGYFTAPSTSVDVQQELSDLTSPVGAFVRQCCVVGPELQVLRDALYQRYRQWCLGENRHRVLDKSGFGRDLRAVVSTLDNHQDHEGIRYYIGLDLRAAVTPQPQQPQHRPQQAREEN